MNGFKSTNNDPRSVTMLDQISVYEKRHPPAKCQLPSQHRRQGSTVNSHIRRYAWSVDRGISLGQLATDEKSNEITAIPVLLENVEVKDAVVTTDAAGCQCKIAKG